MIPFIPVFFLSFFFPDLRVNKTNTKLLIILCGSMVAGMEIED